MEVELSTDCSPVKSSIKYKTILQMVEVHKDGDDNAERKASKSWNWKGRGGWKMISKRKEGIKDNSQPVAEMQKDNINAANAHQLCSGRETNILPQKISQK